LTISIWMKVVEKLRVAPNDFQKECPK